MKVAKRISATLFLVVMVMVLSAGLAYADVASPNDSTRVLSGAISENVDLDEEVTSVVLDGVTMENDARIRIMAEQATVTVSDGTSNKINALEGMGSLVFQGSGDLTGTSIFAMSGLTFNGTGSYSFPGGGILNLSGELAFNSGTFDISSGGDTGYAVASGGGNISLNGANLNLHGRISALYSTGTLVLAGGSLTATSDEDAAVMSGYKISNGITVGDSMTLGDGLKPADLSVEGGTVVTALVDQKGQGAKSVSAQGNSVAPGSVAAQPVTNVPYQNDVADKLINGNQGGDSTGAIVVAVVLVVVVIAGVVFFVVRRKKGKGKGPKESDGPKNPDGPAGPKTPKGPAGPKNTLKNTVAVVLAITLAFYSFDANTLTAYAAEPTVFDELSDSALSDSFSDGLTVQSAIDEQENRSTTYYQDSLITGTIEDNSGTWEYYYSDSYFAQPASTYNASLATASLSMARAAFNVVDFDHEDYSYGHKNIETFLVNNGFKDITPNEGMTIMPTAETIGVTVGNKTILDENGEKCTLVAVAVRGGNYCAEWASNVRMGATGEAEGFAHSRDLVVEHLSSYLSNNSSSFEGNLKIWIAGFSRAAATSNLTGNYLDCAVQNTGENTQLMQTARSALSRYKLDTNDIYCYAFESPQAAHDSSIYKAKDTSNLFYMAIPVDPILAVAPSAYGFTYYGTIIDISDADFSKVTTNALNIDGSLKPYGYVQTPEGETPFRPYIFSGASETIGSVLGSLLTGTPVSKGVFKGYESSYDKADFKSRTEFDNKLLNLVSAAGGTREGFAEELQPYLSVVTEKIMGGTKVEKASFSSAFFKGLRSRANYFELGMLVIEVIRPSAIGNLLMHSVAEGGLTGALWDVPLTVFSCGYRLGMWMKDGACTGATSLHMRIERALGDAINEAHNAKCITDQQYNEASKCTSTVATFLISYLSLDSTRDFQYTLTAAAYGANLFSPHYPSVSMAYLMAKDSNYDTAHKIKVTGWNTKLAQDTKATVYSVNQFDDKKTIATVENGQLVAAPGTTLPETLTLETIQDGFIVSSAYNRADSTNEERIGVDITSSQSVAVEYTNHGNGQKGFTNVTQYFEQVEIPMTIGDTISLRVKNASAEAEFNKTISPQFVYGSHDEENGGYTNITTGRRVSIDNVDTMTDSLGAVEKPLNIGTTYTFTSCDALSGNGYTPFRVYQGTRTADGSIQKDEATGQLKLTRIDSTRGEYSSSPAVTWTATFDLKSTSPVYFVENVSAKDSYSVQMTGVAYNAAKERVAPYGVSLRLTNKTTGQVAYDQSISAKSGDVVCADVAARNMKSVFLRWAVLNSDPRLEISEGSPMDTHFTFVMPCHDVNLEALFFAREGDNEGTLAVFNGTWASEYTSAVPQDTSQTAQKTPNDLGWEELFSEAKEGETSYLTTGSHVLRMKTDEAARSGYLFIEAPEKIEVPSGGVYVFDHWEANYFDHGDGVTDAIAQRLDISYSDTGNVLGARLVSEGENIYYAPHGSTNPILVVPNSLMKESVVFEPIYTPEQYSYAITLADGSTVSGKAKPGQIVNVADVGASGRTFTSWEANYTEVSYKTKEDGSKIRRQETKKLVIPDATNDTLTFVMPRGSVTGHANYDEKLYKLNTMVEVQVEGKTLNVSDVTTPDARYEFGAGENVVLQVKYDGSKSVTGWNCDSSDVVIKPIMGPDGSVDCYTFVMPAHDVTITPILKEAS